MIDVRFNSLLTAIRAVLNSFLPQRRRGAESRSNPKTTSAPAHLVSEPQTKSQLSASPRLRGKKTNYNQRLPQKSLFTSTLDVERWTFGVRIFLLLILTGCSPDPFPRPALPNLINPNPISAQNFPTLLPKEFTSDDTVLLQAPFNNNFAILGVLTLNRPAHTFELAGLNQLGVVFFQIGSDKNGPHITQAIPPLMAHKEILLSMATDIQRIYFDLTPPPNLPQDTTRTELIFHGHFSPGFITYRYGYNPPLLLEKQFTGCFGAGWRVRYYDYRPGAEHKLFPHGIVMDNNQFHYRIIIKNRDWSPPDSPDTTQP